MAARVRSLKGAASFVDRMGIVLLFPKPDVVLPSLYEAVAGPGHIRWMDEREDGTAELTPEVARLWGWKDELPERGLACAGKHVRGWPALISLEVLPSLYALTGRDGEPEDFKQAGLSPLEREVVEVVLAQAPVSSREIRTELGGPDTRSVNRALDSLQRMLILTRAGTVEHEQGWPGTAYDVLARRYGEHLRNLPPPDEARTRLAETVLRSAGELSAPDLAAALGLRRREAWDALDRVVDQDGASRRDQDGILLWRPRRRR